MRFTTASAADMDQVRTGLGAEARADTLQAAAQSCTRYLYEQFRESAALVRTYATIPCEKLPPGDREFVSRLAAANGGGAQLSEKTLVLSLLGTAGARPEWNDRLRSRGHLGIPLLGARFVSGLPMVSRLMTDMGLGLDWLDRQDTEIVVKTVGRLARLFYVDDASQRTDHQGRKLVPAQDFVSANGVKTVFGVGGGYMNGTFVTTIFFTSELVQRPSAEQFLTLINVFKTATLSAVSAGRYH